MDPLDEALEQPARTPARTALSFELIPPRHDADEAKLKDLVSGLAAYKPDYIAVTSSRRSGWLEGTADFIARLTESTNLPTIAHLACTAGTEEELADWIRRLIDSGVRGFLALRGDLPEGETSLPEGYLQYATQLLTLIQEIEEENAYRLAAGKLALSVACYPSGHAESPTPDLDLDVLLSKQRLGADFAITQLFFAAEDYLQFAEQSRMAGVRIPLIPGIMPMTSLKRVERMGVLSGIEVPQTVVDALSSASTPEEEYEAGMQLTVELTQKLLDAGVGGLHIYTHNNLAVTEDLLSRLGIEKPTN
ncbi:methylenetetrahydrofolate reductase [Corynebacterium genitalium ATCC 33030]|uniref:Methylenetetrahydrofolate reductase n=1 Tax=Corynebacterium genitalium ATCC 33030 TaxID=585529 RepID=D7WBR8_9CORY|nr:methylenetetrahydrofolate reductase [Corynebacterium genitalium]EFK55299.1 methylenetetrahydrofolate reductase (NAD(P)H) [Corynebacterium genitalium ATCC 33030]UUA89450.1 methylenetetrahydrofolate reductase [Corynebacterium genitalium ATCC 33030]